MWYGGVVWWCGGVVVWWCGEIGCVQVSTICMRVACCVLRAACCVLRAACCVMLCCMAWVIVVRQEWHTSYHCSNQSSNEHLLLLHIDES